MNNMVLPYAVRGGLVLTEGCNQVPTSALPVIGPQLASIGTPSCLCGGRLLSEASPLYRFENEPAGYNVVSSHFPRKLKAAP
jgi:hypothetical protein